MRKDIETPRRPEPSSPHTTEEDFRVRPIRTDIFSVGDVLEDFIVRSVPKEFIREGIILAITSKIISLAEGAVVPRDGISKGDLIRRESDEFLGETLFGVSLTIKHGILIPSAGIDESNSATGDFILFPKDPYASARKLHEELSRRWGIREWGLVVTDSHTQPLRKGVTGIGLAHWGFKATKDLIGSQDHFGREAKMTHVNVLDAIAVAAVYRMGEIAERCPLAIVYGSGAEFTASSSADEIQISLDEDLYGTLIRNARQLKV